MCDISNLVLSVLSKVPRVGLSPRPKETHYGYIINSVVYGIGSRRNGLIVSCCYPLRGNVTWVFSGNTPDVGHFDID